MQHLGVGPMPFDALNFRDADAASMAWPGTGELRAARRDGSGVDLLTAEVLERLDSFAFRQHALDCCPCGQDHSPELLAHKLSLSQGAWGFDASFLMPGPQLAPVGTPEAATVIVGGDAGSTPGTAGVLVIGDSAVSQVEVSGDQDWYAVVLQAGMTYEFTLTGTGESPLGDPFLEIMNASGQQLAFNDDGADGLGSFLRFTPVTSGT